MQGMSRRLCGHTLSPPHIPVIPPEIAQIGHAGDGGLYAEMVQDRSFDALSAATGFSAAAAARHPVDLPALAARHRHPMQPLHTPWENPSNRSYSSKREYLEERGQDANYDPLWVAARGLSRCCCRAPPRHTALQLSMGIESKLHLLVLENFQFQPPTVHNHLHPAPAQVAPEAAHHLSVPSQLLSY
jgi:hypothetical protein